MLDNQSNQISSYFLSFKNFIGIIISIICIYFVLESFNWIEFIKQLAKLNYFHLFFSILCLMISIILRAVRWRKIFGSNDVKIPDLYKAEVIGFWGNSLFPLRLGEIIRIHYAKVLTLKRYSFIFGTIILERLIDLLIIMPFVFIFYYYFPIEIINSKMNFLLFTIPILIIGFIGYKYFFQSIKDKFLRDIQVNLIQNFIDNIILLGFLSLSIWVLILLDVYFVQASMNLKFSMLDCLLIMLVATIVYAIPSSPGTIGTFHLAIQEVMVQFLGYTIDTSIAFAFILHAHSYLFFIILGSYYFFKDSKNILSFRK